MAKGIEIGPDTLMWWVFRPTRDSEMADVVYEGHLEDLELCIIGGAVAGDTGGRLVAGYGSRAPAEAHGQRLLDAKAAEPQKDCKACDGTGQA